MLTETGWLNVKGAQLTKNPKNRAVKTNDLSADFGYTSEVGRESGGERRGPSMKEWDKLGGGMSGGG